MSEKVFTQEELDEAIKAKLEEKEAELKKQHDSDMASVRIKAKQEQENLIKKAKEEATLSAEEIAKKNFEEETKAREQELATLRSYKKQVDLTKKLTEAGIPSFFVNDTRLLNAEEDKVPEVIKTIKAELTSVLPKGATITTNVVGSGNPVDAKAEKMKEFAKMR